ncbi:hypothetical protein NUU61_007467 [Penicillium alfredii]|uniref:Uncharacterized protein n=1 Tax=Penicillium alfredii TaxID=1506179 RepID=A0A9W9K576_9EURO|nr:uncharacterized protein NUU61_007467 [Penicillium alfredii]KAJ5092597.1 hypothetical protein NUU61_007467 [Penicillium alfredii]
MQTTNKLPPWSVTHSWTLSSDTPHIKMCMYHGTDGDPSRVFRGELFSMIAIRLQRLQLEELKKHLIIPVMLISFVGEEHDRILLTHFNGEKLIIHMSPLDRFRVEDEDSMLLFTRYLASDIDPQGVTKSLDLKKPLDSGVLSNVGKPGDSRHSVSHATPLGSGK